MNTLRAQITTIAAVLYGVHPTRIDLPTYTTTRDGTPLHGVALISYTASASSTHTWELLARAETTTSTETAAQALLDELRVGMGRVIATFPDADMDDYAAETWTVTHSRVPDVVNGSKRGGEVGGVGVSTRGSGLRVANGEVALRESGGAD